MKMLIDTNVILDFLLKRDEQSSQFFIKAVSGLDELYITTNQLTDINYFLEKFGRNGKQELQKLLHVVELLDVTKTQSLAALENPMPDFEDALIVEVALANSISTLITRNVEDFTDERVMVRNPSEF